MKSERDNDTVWVRIPLDGTTAIRLLRLSDAIKEDASKIAASLLHDILQDDEDAHNLAGIPPAEIHRLN